MFSSIINSVVLFSKLNIDHKDIETPKSNIPNQISTFPNALKLQRIQPKKAQKVLKSRHKFLQIIRCAKSNDLPQILRKIGKNPHDSFQPGYNIQA